MADEIDDILGAAPPAPADDEPEQTFLKPGWRRPKAAPEGDDIDAILGAASPPDRIGQANADYAANTAALRPGQSAPPAEPVTSGQAAARGALQGASLGFGDEIAAGIDTLTSKIPGVRSFAQAFNDAGTPSLENPDLTYAERREAYRAKNQAAQEQHPYAYGAGEIGGGLATAGLTPGFQAAKGAGIAGKAAAAAMTGGALGAIQGLGASSADLTQGQFGQAFRDASGAGAAGALVGGALGGVGAKLVQDAEKNATGWVVKDIIGETRGASTATARQHLAEDADSAVRLLKGDKELAGSIESARHGGVDELRKAQEVIQDRLADAGKKLEPRWNEVSKQLPAGGVRAGDLADHLANRVEELRATGLTSDAAEADALDAIRKRVTGARDFGAKTVTTLDEKATADLGALRSVRANVKDPATLKQIDDQIAALQKTGTKQVQFDPDHIVPARQIQKLWSDEAGIAYDSHGGINGTPAFKKKLEVASHLREFRDQVLEQAAGGNPKVVAELRSLNSDYAGLKRIGEVVDQRLNRAVQDAAGASTPATLTKLLHRSMHAGGLTGIGAAAATGHYKTAAGMAALQAGFAGKRLLDKGVSRLVQQPDSVLARTILSLMQRGIPQATAIQMARAGGPAIANAIPGQTP